MDLVGHDHICAQLNVRETVGNDARRRPADKALCSFGVAHFRPRGTEARRQGAYAVCLSLILQSAPQRSAGDAEEMGQSTIQNLEKHAEGAKS